VVLKIINTPHEEREPQQLRVVKLEDTEKAGHGFFDDLFLNAVFLLDDVPKQVQSHGSFSFLVLVTGGQFLFQGQHLKVKVFGRERFHHREEKVDVLRIKIYS